jgi:hypothetical protein
MNRIPLYLAVNLLFATALAIGAANTADSGVHPLYLLLLFALCSTPLLQLRRLNDRYVLLGLFSGVYFLFYGVLDLSHLMQGIPGPRSPGAWISEAELVILAGAALVQLCYRLACRRRGEGGRTAGDWPEGALVIGGGLLWLVCTWLTWQFKVYVVTDSVVENQQRGLASIGGFKAAAYILAGYLEPLGMLILAYAQSKYRRPYMVPVLVAVVLVQLFIGFVVDVKGEALLGFVIVVLTKVLVEGRLPRRWLIAGAIFLVLAWPVLQANRTVREQHSLNHAQVAHDFVRTLQLALETKSSVMQGPDRAATVFERLSMKGSVDMIVSRTGRDVRYQDGHTLGAILTAFIPRLIWPDKPDVQTGLLLNKEFQVDDDVNVYISPSHLGELYWNFGWSGVIAGMSLFGLLLGYVGARFDLSQSATLTRVMLLVLTLRLLVLGFESAIAPQYVVWIRCLVAVGLLHLLLARVPAGPQALARGGREEEAPAAPAGGMFPNLMR